MATSAYGIYNVTVKTDQMLADLHYSNLSKSDDPNAIKIRGDTIENGLITIMTNLGPNRIASGIAIGSIRPCLDAAAETRVNESITKIGYHKTLSYFTETTLKVNDDGISTNIDQELRQFLNTCSAVALDPGNINLRNNLISAGKTVSSHMNEAAKGYQDITNLLQTQFNEMANEINNLATNISEINSALRSNQDSSDASLLVEQNRLLRKLSEYGNLDIAPLSSNGVGIKFGEFNLVDFNGSYPLPTTYNAATQCLTDGTNYAVNSGAVAGLFRSMVINSNAQASLDTLSNSFSSQVNALHSIGTNLLGNTNINFFDTTVPGAIGLKLNSVVANDPKAIATSVSGNVNDGRLMLQIVQLKNTPIAALGNITFQQYQSNFIFDLSTQSGDAKKEFELNSKILQSNMRQASQSRGISKEEEGFELYKHVSHIETMTQYLKVLMRIDESKMELIK